MLKQSTMHNFVQKAPLVQLATSYLSWGLFRHPWKALMAWKKWKLIQKYHDFCWITSLPPSTVDLSATPFSQGREIRHVLICSISYYGRGGNKTPKPERSVGWFLVFGEGWTDDRQQDSSGQSYGRARSHWGEPVVDKATELCLWRDEQSIRETQEGIKKSVNLWQQKKLLNVFWIVLKSLLVHLDIERNQRHPLSCLYFC